MSAAIASAAARDGPKPRLGPASRAPLPRLLHPADSRKRLALACEQLWIAHLRSFVLFPRRIALSPAIQRFCYRGGRRSLLSHDLALHTPGTNHAAPYAAPTRVRTRPNTLSHTCWHTRSAKKRAVEVQA